jgi:hypothetical protein
MTGRKIILRGVDVVGPISPGLLSGLTCRSCTFFGPVGNGNGATLTKPVDLAGSRFLGNVDFADSTFLAAVKCTNCLFLGRFTAAGATFAQSVDFRVTAFRRYVSFEGTKFAAPVAFTNCRFESFSAVGAVFSQSADFRGAEFQSLTLFEGAKFGNDALFVGAAFSGQTDFTDTTAQHAADFTQTFFQSFVTFHHAQFNESISFVASELVGGGDFGFLVSGGNVDFSGSVMNSHRGRGFVFDFMTAKGAVDFSQAAVATGVQFEMENISASALKMSVSIVDHVDGYDQKVTILKQIQASAKASGDLNAQNDAEYELHVLASQKYALPLRILDFVFYRSIAGYFVRPLNPLIVWILFVAVMAGTRLARRTDLRRYPWKRPQGRRLRSVASVGAAGVRALEEFADTLTYVGPRRGEAGSDRSALEVNISRALVACILVALASASPTLTQFVHAF